ncbi:DUF2085 domain-containing protein [Paenibacillus polymyxa]|uniref:Membrane protein n=1 Tax=Paenibacillus polymyxa (strain SC2) TaxID=886882 RepID=A0A0D5ZCY2_PAEPS|nr:DUF2085 domain-containing protein [Paenibacillus polymyxa]AKA44382.1 membrane protein [Paenibacillus polymyxa SC2]WPQ60041.1 DUF2085 domain-containing protein [Paenibacillus polymyxa]
MRWIPCHRRPDRSLHIHGKPMMLCARCTSVLLGYAISPIMVGFHIKTSYFWIVVLLLPLLIDGYTQLWKWRKSNNVLRLLTGFSFGIGQALLISNIVWFLVEILK